MFCLILSFCFSKSNETSGNVEQEEKKEQKGEEVERKEIEEALLQLRDELINVPELRKKLFKIWWWTTLT